MNLSYTRTGTGTTSSRELRKIYKLDVEFARIGCITSHWAIQRENNKPLTYILRGTDR
jgi:hypothetical protein